LPKITVIRTHYWRYNKEIFWFIFCWTRCI